MSTVWRAQKHKNQPIALIDIWQQVLKLDIHNLVIINNKQILNIFQSMSKKQSSKRL